MEKALRGREKALGADHPATVEARRMKAQLEMDALLRSLTSPR